VRALARPVVVAAAGRRLLQKLIDGVRYRRPSCEG
jgi:hypothetical protein